MQETIAPVEFKKRIDRLFRFMGAKSQEDGARKLGLPPATVSRWVNGHQRPSHIALQLIEQAEQKYCDHFD